jgi:choline dehydrogenase
MNEGRGYLTTTSDNRIVLLSVSMLHGDAGKLAKYDGGTTQYLRAGTHKDYEKAYRRQHELLLASMATEDLAVAENSQLGVRTILVKPLSRGHVAARTADIWDPPAVNHRTFAHPLDLENVIGSLRFGRRILATPDVAGLDPVETAPGPAVQSDGEFETYVRAGMSAGGAHGCCAAAMGTVLDAQMRVRGVRGLRVIDTSAWPMIPGSHAMLVS